MPYPILDASHGHVRDGGQVRSIAPLVAIGLDPKGERSIHGVGASPSEAEAYWRVFLASLPGRGLHGVELVVAGDHAGSEGALAARPTGVPRRRCRVGPMEDAPAFVPRPSMREEVVASLRAAFDAPDRAEPEAERRLDIAAEGHRAGALMLAGWRERNVPEGRSYFDLPPSPRRRRRTIGVLEALDEELEGRRRMARLLRDEASAPRLVGAVAMEVSEEWEANREYPAIEPDRTAAGAGDHRNELHYLPGPLP